jgi:hypothetical protein
VQRWGGGGQASRRLLSSAVDRSGADSAGISNDARVETHTQAALQSTNSNDTQARRGSHRAAVGWLWGCRRSAGGTGVWGAWRGFGLGVEVLCVLLRAY